MNGKHGIQGRRELDVDDDVPSEVISEYHFEQEEDEANVAPVVKTKRVLIPPPSNKVELEMASMPVKQVTTQDIRDKVLKKVEGFDPESTGEESEFSKGDKIGWYAMVSRYASGGDLCLFYLGSFSSMGFGAALPAFCLLFGEMIDGVAASNDAGGFEGLQTQAFYMLYIGAGVMFIAFAQVSLMAVFAENVAFKIKKEYFRQTIQKDAAWFDENNATEMASRISKECVTIQRGSGEKVGNLVMSYSGFVFGMLFSFYWGWLYTCILLAATPLLAGTGVMIGWSMEDGQVGKMKAYAQSAGYAEQALSSIKVVHTYGQEFLEKENYQRFLGEAKRCGDAVITRTALGQGAMYSIFFFLYAFAFYFGGLLVWDEVERLPGEKYTGGVVIAVIFSVIFGSLQLSGATPHLAAVSEGQVAGRMAFNVIDHKPTIHVNEEGSKVIDKKSFQGLIQMKNVSFTYPSRPELRVLKNFSCTFEKGKTIALVGPSGSGKSTVIQLVERFYDPESGEILIDGMPFKSLNLTSVRNQIGYVSQEPVLFNTTIRENLLFAKPDATEDEIENALKAANAWDFIMQKFPDGLETMVGQGGGQLSGGQKQRIAIARAFIKEPKVLLLDEATSALDKVNEQIVQAAIEGYRKAHGDITIIVIAHRLSTIRDADKIVVLKNGELTESGTHEELLENYPEGTYAGFVAKQASAEAGYDDELQEDPDQMGASLKESIVLSEKGSRKGSVKSLKEELKYAEATRSPEEQDIFDQVEKHDEKLLAEITAEKEKLAKLGNFSKILEWNNPKILILIGSLMGMFNGVLQPTAGIVMSKLLSVLSLPEEYLVDRDDPTIKGAAYIEQEVTFWSIAFAIMAAVALCTYFIGNKSFGTLGENVTIGVRTALYDNILRKNIGWFDHPENGTSVLTSAMAQDTSVLNGVSTGSIGPILEATCSFVGGIAIGYVFCWQEATICVCVAPIMVVGNALGMQFQAGLTGEQNELNGKANLLCGDSIVNFRTVQSFGNTELIIKKYVEYLEPAYLKSKAGHLKIGAAFGISNFAQYFTFAAMFYGGGLILQDNATKEDGDKINPEDVFIALFAIMFGASQAGAAGAYAPDIGKAKAAAERIFGIIEHPSTINAIEIDKDKKYQRLPLESVRGKIEFRNVWFRYPTRTEDFVLKDLNIIINPEESVALVGESGCGKSTFVNLLMRFYDPDQGQIFLDGVDIKTMNLHDLRTAISLVMQEPIIFNYSILENILYGKSNASNSEVLHAAQVSNCIEFIDRPTTNPEDVDNSAQALIQLYVDKEKEIVDLIGKEKYDEEMDVLKKCEEQEKKQGKFQVIAGSVDQRDASLKDVRLSDGFTQTQCGLKGGKLSGGQKQRVAIARTIIRNPKILLLDEATSALDEDSQKKVQEALNNAMAGKTTIIIAHRMSTIENCDKIFVLESGHVKEEGNFKELKSRKDGYFAKKK